MPKNLVGALFALSTTLASPNGSAVQAVSSTTATACVSGGDGIFDNGFNGYTIYPGAVGVDLINRTCTWSNEQIFVTVIGINPATGSFAHVSANGTLTDVAEADNNAPGHLTKNGQNYPNYAFTLAQTRLLKLPKMDSGRAFVSTGEPVYLKIIGNGYAGPNPQNPSDPNIDVHFDWYEFTYNNGGMFINTTQVDEFGLPMVLDVWGNGASFHQRTGITESIAQIDQAFANETPAAFQPVPMSNLRILSPTKLSFGAGGTNAHYYDAYVSAIWTQYQATPLVVNLFGGQRRFSGTTTPTTFNFTEINLNNGAYVGNAYKVYKPSTQDILQCSGTMAQGDPVADINTVQLALQAQFCAAFNRHVMHDVSLWTTPSAWYAAAPANFYAQFWHRHSIGGLAYGFAYDDVSEQSSTITTGQPEHMAFTIYW